ncbi:unnamed protein product [Durusdinium trenchii]|uniref:Poly(A) RNA polymerase mitochondrial-like central palm domain-containing protein n=2 Tax=Durusdinium trenchii TaxID=1381693 RepID=A0ABP0HBJ8_9DINO
MPTQQHEEEVAVSDPYQLKEEPLTSDDEDKTRTEESETEEDEDEDAQLPNAGSDQGLSSLGRTLRSLLPSESFEQMVREAERQVEEASRVALGPNTTVKSFGSTLQGTFLEGSDLDLYICSSREYDTRHTHDEQVKMLRFLEAELRKSFKSFEVKERRFEWHVRVPILILLFQSHQHELQVDISVGELDHVGVQKGFVDRLIRAALTKGEVALPMVLLVKRWAKVENLNKAFEGSLSPLAWTLLCLYFLICKDRLPKEALAVPAEEPVPRRNAVKLCQNCPTQQELSDFFDMVSELGQKAQATKAAHETGPFGVSLLPWKECHGETSDKAFFFIEDPAARLRGITVNVARGVKDQERWKNLLKRCEGARNLLRSKVFNSDNFLRQRAKQVPQGQAKIKAKPRPQPPRPEKKPMPKPPQTRVPAPLKPGVVKASPPPGVNGRQQDATLQKDKRDGHWRARSSDWRNAKRSRTYSWQQQEQQGWQRTPRMTWNV